MYATGPASASSVWPQGPRAHMAPSIASAAQPHIIINPRPGYYHPTQHQPTPNPNFGCCHPTQPWFSSAPIPIGHFHPSGLPIAPPHWGDVAPAPGTPFAPAPAITNCVRQLTQPPTVLPPRLPPSLANQPANPFQSAHPAGQPSRPASTEQSGSPTAPPSAPASPPLRPLTFRTAPSPCAATTTAKYPQATRQQAPLPPQHKR